MSEILTDLCGYRDIPSTDVKEVAIWTNPVATLFLENPHHGTHTLAEKRYFNAHANRPTIVLIEAKVISHDGAIARYERSGNCFSDTLADPTLLEDMTKKEFHLDIAERHMEFYEAQLAKIGENPNYHFMPVFQWGDRYALTKYNSNQLARHVAGKHTIVTGHHADIIVPDLIEQPTDIEYVKRFIQR